MFGVSNRVLLKRTEYVDILDQPEATFYHITTLEVLEHIEQTGLISKDGRIFVSRVGELPVLLSYCI